MRYRITSLCALLIALLGGPLATAGPATAATTAVRTAPPDVQQALAQLPAARILDTGTDGLPSYLQGDLGHLGSLPTDPALAGLAVRNGLGAALGALRLQAADLHLRRAHEDARGNRHFRFSQRFQGLEVIGADLVAHVDAKGTVYALNGTARGLSRGLGSSDIGAAAATSFVAADPNHSGMRLSSPRPVYVLDGHGGAWKAYEVLATGQRGPDPVSDKVYVDTDSGRIVAVHPQIHTAKNRRIYSSNNTTTLPGTLNRTELTGPTRDADVNAVFDHLGETYDAYKAFFARDSFDNAGAALIGSVHYETNYCNAFWNGQQMVFGDGNVAVGCLRLSRAVDITAHELTHAVTDRESHLIYSGESGGLDEAISDMFGAFVEAWVDGGKTGVLAVSDDTWRVGEDVLTPALRYMNDPAADGASLDYYTSSAGQSDVHYSSGIANLAFYLLAQGGTHPRHKSSIVVNGIGMEKALRIFYKANVDILTSGSSFLTAANATVQTAQELGYDLATQAAVSDAWQAVGVAAGAPGQGGSETVLANQVPVPGLQDSKGAKKFFVLQVPRGATSLTFKLTIGSGDADLYVRQGAHPSLSAYDCRSYKLGSLTETCSFANPAPGPWYVMINAYTAYSGATLTGSYVAPTPADDVPALTNGVGVTVSGAQGSQQYWKIATPAGRKLTITISGGTGDADLYTRFGSKPTTTSWDCRPYLNGISETCTVNSTLEGNYYVMVRGYAAFSGVNLKASYP